MGVSLSYNDIKRKLTLPEKMSEELAEFMGIVAGDGHVNKYSTTRRTEYVIGLSGNSIKDREYFEFYILPLVNRLFNIQAKIYKKKGQNTIATILRSKGLFEFLKSLGIHVGPKTNWLIPKIIIQNKQFHKAYLRGIFDTDGCVSLKTYNHGYPVIKIKQKSRNAIEQISQLLKNLGFYFYTEYDVITKDKRGFESIGSSIYISGWKNLRRWVELIGSSNLRNLKKINLALSMGRG